jgi:hypothetical protein
MQTLLPYPSFAESARVLDWYVGYVCGRTETMSTWFAIFWAYIAVCCVGIVVIVCCLIVDLLRFLRRG